ncbi:MAG TPA: hypothetical protein IAC35_01270 [Candidatus Cryptobacteroides merdipullorum]|uniref:Uncharacterized protein n=1 Tax=Candidatus Cryptobacteroides merdipullorum TaxID=2840771 RepID=A0A9D1GMG6_9BACT|nr:hypothetical protein [Candidatus Cryptobacteroides merdipullorum]
MSFRIPHPARFAVLAILVALILTKKVVTTPEKLLDEMPAAIGPQFQGEWALYTCSMLAAALENISGIYPETRAESAVYIDSLITIVLSPEIRA